MDEIVPDEGHKDDMEIDPNKLNLSSEMLYRVQNLMLPAQRDFFLRHFVTLDGIAVKFKQL